jgi:hypothetical protein
MIFTPWGPSAGPIGGAGVAFPADIWSFTWAIIGFLAIVLYPPALFKLLNVNSFPPGKN